MAIAQQPCFLHSWAQIGSAVLLIIMAENEGVNRCMLLNLPGRRRHAHHIHSHGTKPGLIMKKAGSAL